MKPDLLIEFDRKLNKTGNISDVDNIVTALSIKHQTNRTELFKSLQKLRPAAFSSSNAAQSTPEKTAPADRQLDVSPQIVADLITKLAVAEAKNSALILQHEKEAAVYKESIALLKKAADDLASDACNKIIENAELADKLSTLEKQFAMLKTAGMNVTGRFAGVEAASARAIAPHSMPDTSASLAQQSQIVEPARTDVIPPQSTSFKASKQIPALSLICNVNKSITDRSGVAPLETCTKKLPILTRTPALLPAVSQSFDRLYLTLLNTAPSMAHIFMRWNEANNADHAASDMLTLVNAYLTEKKITTLADAHMGKLQTDIAAYIEHEGRPLSGKINYKLLYLKKFFIALAGPKPEAQTAHANGVVASAEKEQEHPIRPNTSLRQSTPQECAYFGYVTKERIFSKTLLFSNIVLDADAQLQNDQFIPTRNEALSLLSVASWLTGLNGTKIHALSMQHLDRHQEATKILREWRFTHMDIGIVQDAHEELVLQPDFVNYCNDPVHRKALIDWGAGYINYCRNAARSKAPPTGNIEEATL